MGKYHLTSPKIQHLPTTAIYSNSNRKYIFLTQISSQVYCLFTQALFQWQTGCFKPQNLSGAETSGWNGSMWGRGSPLAAAHCHSPLKKRGYLGVPYCFNTSRYFWCGKLFLLPKKILHLFLSIQISVIWNLNSYLGHFFFSPKAVFLADMEVLDKLISWKQFIAVNWATPLDRKSVV